MHIDAVDVGVGQKTGQSLAGNFEKVAREHADGPQIHRIVQGVPIRALGFHHLQNALGQGARNQPFPAEGVQGDDAQGAAGSGNTHPGASHGRQLAKGLDSVQEIQGAVDPGETGPGAGRGKDLVLHPPGNRYGRGRPWRRPG